MIKKTLWNLFALLGLLTLVLSVAGGALVKNTMHDFDPGAADIYTDFVTKLLETKDPASAMVWSVPVAPDLEPEDVIESLKSLAVKNNFLFVGESPFYKQAEAVSGSPFRFVSFLNFCDVRVGMKMANYNDAYTAFMPCTISLVQDKQGKLWLYSMNMDFLIHGARELPEDLKRDALRVRTVLHNMMHDAAKGEF